MADPDATRPGGGGPGEVDVQQLKSDVTRLREDFSRLLQSGAEAAREQVELRQESARSAMAAARARGGRVLGRAQHLIEDRPIAAVLVAFGVGILIAKAMDRR